MFQLTVRYLPLYYRSNCPVSIFSSFFHNLLIKGIIEGKELPAGRSPLSAADPGPGGDVQKILKPEKGAKPGFTEGQPSPA